MAINKVVYGNNTLIDLTEDTVSADKLLAGETAHDRSGASIEGTVVTTEIWTGTQAEYEAQASQIADGTVVQITDDEKAITFIEAEEIYSTDERMVGVWVNGKPLYKKSFLFNTQVTVTTTWTDIGLVLDEADSIIFGETQRSTAYAPLEFEIVPSTHHIRAVSYRATSIPVGSFVTLYYTKTADVAGSGDFVPSGAPAVHYSTDEQVVGTWIDGSTLYEKTYLIAKSDLVSQGSNDYNYVWSVPFDEIADLKGMIHYNNFYAPFPSGTSSSAYQNYISQLTNSNIQFTFGASMWSQLQDVKITLIYTKTS